MFGRFRERLRPAPPVRGAGLEVVAAPSRILPAGSRPLVYTAGTGSAQLVSAGAVDLLARLEGCRPLERVAWEGRDAAADELLRRGLLVTREALLRALADAADPGASSEIAAVAWLARGRPAALARSIRSFAVNAARHGRCPRWLVFDDGDEGEAARTLEALAPLPAREGIRLSYCGPREKSRMAARLHEATRGSLPDELVRFALFGLPGYGTTCGANRNSAMLALCGAPVLVADDDTVCEPAVHPARDGGLSITSARDPSDLLCFGSREQVLSGVPRVQDDYLAVHESILGRSAGACARVQAAEEIDLSGLSPALAELLLRGGGRVVATTGGVYGDAIVNDPGYLLWVEGETRERIVASEESFRTARISREVLRCPRRAAIGDSDLLYGASLGLDCSEMLPPFLPMGRGQDILFALTVHLCLPGALIGRPAVAVLHDPVVRRDYPASGRSVPGMQAFDLLAVLERSHIFPAWAHSCGERLRSLGIALEELGRLPLPEFVDAVTPEVLKARAAQLSAACEFLDRHRRAPGYWAREVESHIRGMQEQIADMPITPVDVESLDAFRLQIALYGALLQVWPAMWCAAREVATRGQRAGVDLP